MALANTELSKLIKKRRKEQMLSLRKFASTVGLSPTYVSQLENGEARSPSEETLARMATVLGEDVDALLKLAGRIPSDVANIIRTNPQDVVGLLRKANKLEKEDWKELERFLGDKVERS